MTRCLAISAQPGEIRAAWIENQRLQELSIQRDDRPSFADNIYLGRVVGLDKALDAAFVDIGLARPGFLPRAEGPKGLSAGDSLIVRVKREPAADKGARLSALRAGLPPEFARGVARDAASGKPPALLRDAADPLAAVLTTGRAPDDIVIDDEAWHARATAAFAGRPDLLALLRLDPGPGALFERLGLEASIDALLEPQFGLPSGGSLLFEPVRTLTAIDVNAGRHGAGGAGGQALAVNLEAAAAIPRQVRLRNLSGLLVIDFLALGDATARRRVTEALKRDFAADPNPLRIQAMRPSGLVEMTRRRARPPLHEILSEPCGLQGSGRIKSAPTLAFEALRQLRAAATGRPLRRLGLQAAPAIATALAGPCAAARTALEARIGRALEIGTDAGQDGFRIVLE